MKERYAVGSLTDRKVHVNHVYDKYTQHGTLSQREFCLLLHKTFPSIKTVNGPTINKKRVKVYAGLIELSCSDEMQAAADHGYARKPLREINGQQPQTPPALETDCRLVRSYSCSSSSSWFEELSDDDHDDADYNDENDPDYQVENDPDYNDVSSLKKAEKKVKSTNNFEDIIRLLPPQLQSGAFTSLLKEQTVQASKGGKTAHRWSVR